MLENQILDNSTQDELQITPQARALLKTAAGWAKFIGIAGLGMLGFFIIGLLTFSSKIIEFVGSTNQLGDEFGGNEAMMSQAIDSAITLYIVIFAVAAIPYFFLLRFGIDLKQAIVEQNSKKFTSSANNLKNHLLIVGIFVIIGLFFTVLIVFSFATILATLGTT